MDGKHLGEAVTDADRGCAGSLELSEPSIKFELEGHASRQSCTGWLK